MEMRVSYTDDCSSFLIGQRDSVTTNTVLQHSSVSIHKSQSPMRTRSHLQLVKYSSLFGDLKQGTYSSPLQVSQNKYASSSSTFKIELADTRFTLSDCWIVINVKQSQFGYV